MSKGRVKGSKKSVVKISDKVISPYYIQQEESQFTLFKEGSTLAIGYYNTLSSALQRISKEKFLQKNSQKELTISEYIKEYQQVNQSIINSISL